MRIELLQTLSADAEALLEARAVLRGRDPDRSLAQIRRALEAGRVNAACLYDDAGSPQGIAAWRWQDSARAYAQVLVLYVQPGADPALGVALVDFVFSELIRTNTLAVIEVRMRDDSPGVRDAWLQRGVAIFERCRMVRRMGYLPVPVAPVPDHYRIARWEDIHQPGVEQVVRAARRDSIDAVAVPEMQTERLLERLRSLRAGRPPDPDSWNADASLVALDQRERVVGYVGLVSAGEGAQVVDLGVDPAHRRRGLARAMLARSMAVCLRQGVVAVGAAVTTRNPVLQLVNQLGFQPVDCGEVAIWWRDGRHQPWRV